MRSTLRTILCLVILLVALVRPAQATPMLYTYTGQDFTNFAGDARPQAWANLSGWFTLTDPLSPLLGSAVIPAAVVPLDFSFTDGWSTLTPTTIDRHYQYKFALSTDPAGLIQSWMFSLYAVDHQRAFISDGRANGTDQTVLPSPIQTQAAMTVDSPGVWTATDVPVVQTARVVEPPTQPVPEPSTWALLLTGLALVGLGRQRRLA